MQVGSEIAELDADAAALPVDALVLVARRVASQLSRSRVS
jgi:hypothetical protein